MHAIWFTITGVRDDVALRNAVDALEDVKTELEVGPKVTRVRLAGSSSKYVSRARKTLNLAVIDCGGSMRLGR